jgi:hypothetical protein
VTSQLFRNRSNIKRDSFGNVAKLKYLGTTVKESKTQQSAKNLIRRSHAVTYIDVFVFPSPI